MSLINNISGFFKGVVSELKKVNWPGRREVLYLSLIVIISVVVAIMLINIIDLALSKILEWVIARG